MSDAPLAGARAAAYERGWRDDAVPHGARPTAALPDAADSPLGAALREHPTVFEFFQAVRVLARMHPDRAPVGGFGDPADELVRFRANTDYSFPPGEIAALDEPGEGPARMTVNFMGLTGPQGVLPLQYSALVAERVRARDTALRDFLGIFDHRAISLFYRAWEKQRLSVAHERDRRDRLTTHLLDLVGLGTAGLSERLPFEDDALVFYAGLLALRTRPASALEQLVADYFDVPAEVEQFVGAWYPLDDATCCQLGESRAESGMLGGGAVVGDETWDQQSCIRLRLGPMSRARYESFLPTGDAHGPLRALVRFFAGDALAVEARLVLARDEVIPLALDAETPAPLGWATWLATRRPARDPDDTILTL